MNRDWSAYDVKSRYWQLQDAKNRFSEVVDMALSQGPQTITRRGEPVVVVVPVDVWRGLTLPEKSLKAYLAASPIGDLYLARDSGEREDVELP